MLSGGKMDVIMNTVFQNLLDDAVKFHGHLCGGQVLGVRMAMAGLRELGIEDPKGVQGRNLVIFIEIDRCAADAIISVTGRTPGKRSIKIMDYGKMAATFVDTESGKAVRICVRPESNAKVSEMTQKRMSVKDETAGTIEALTAISETELLKIRPVNVELRPQDLPGTPLASVNCAFCGETIRDMREIQQGGKVLCRPCADNKAYYTEIEDTI
jgi:formylmethanofuran dehydrogenase subunit E